MFHAEKTYGPSTEHFLEIIPPSQIDDREYPRYLKCNLLITEVVQTRIDSKVQISPKGEEINLSWSPKTRIPHLIELSSPW